MNTCRRKNKQVCRSVAFSPRSAGSPAPTFEERCFRLGRHAVHLITCQACAARGTHHGVSPTRAAFLCPPSLRAGPSAVFALPLYRKPAFPGFYQIVQVSEQEASCPPPILGRFCRHSLHDSLVHWFRRAAQALFRVGGRSAGGARADGPASWRHTADVQAAAVRVGGSRARMVGGLARWCGRARWRRVCGSRRWGAGGRTGRAARKACLPGVCGVCVARSSRLGLDGASSAADTCGRGRRS